MSGSKTGDGLVSRYLNRKLSQPITALLVRTAVTPNQVSAAAFVLALGAAIALMEGHLILGGLLVQLSSVIDGVDGELARAKGMVSVFGGFFDALLDRYSDAIIILGMMVYVLRTQPELPVGAVAILALAGSFAISYSRAKVEAAGNLDFTQGALGLASRDIRLLIFALGSVAGWVFWSLVVVAIWTNAVLGLRILAAHRNL